MEQDAAYQFLFPFEKVPYGSRVLIYGAGKVGREYLQQLLITEYCTPVAFVDRAFEAFPPMVIPIYAPQKIKELEFDYAVIALHNQIALNEIIRTLKDEGVKEERIVYVGERKQSEILIANDAVRSIITGATLAYQSAEISAAIFSAGGLGDSIIQKRWVMALLELVPDLSIDFYSNSPKDFLQLLYSDIPQIRNVFPNQGKDYERNMRRYSVAFSICGSGYIKVDSFAEDSFDAYPDFAEKIRSLKKITEKELVGNAIPQIVLYLQRIKLGYDCYSGFRYGDIFPIRDNHVPIPLDERYFDEYKDMKLGKYISFNFGNGDCYDESMVAKSWPVQYFEELLALFRERYPRIEVVQLGTTGAKQIAGANRYILGRPMGLVNYVLKHAILHIDIEGGLVHLATQLGTKCVVLFGPTSQKYYGYETNINLSVGDCHDCCGFYLDIYKCARGLSRPPCMYELKPEFVMRETARYIDALYLHTDE